jgi:pimeloyl-ACP methyl ester carboxylesterase
MATSDSTTARVVTSRDGTLIAYEHAGTGPPLILVDAALHYRQFSSFGGLIRLLAPDFTVYHYDRRGRGASTDIQPYDIEREVEDLAAVVDQAGGSAFVYGFSSGGLLALHAAAHGLAIPRLALLEPPIATDKDRPEQAAFTAKIEELLAAGRREAAVSYVLASIGVPDDVLAGMREDRSWSAMEAVAHTLVYDSTLSRATSYQLLESITVPTLVLDSQGSSDDLTGMAATVAEHLPNAAHRSLAGQWHGISDDVLAPALTEFFRR